MKIISQYKDYYDYLQGVYGQDEKLILDRSKGNPLSGFVDGLRNEDADEARLFIMGRVFDLVCYNKKWYTHEQLYDLGKARFKGKRMETSYIGDLVINHKTGKPYPFTKSINYTDNNNKLNCPIILNNSDNIYNAEPILYPRLAAFNFASIISAEDMWVNLYNWLSRVKEEPNNQTDKEKIVAAGFDLKTSFRNM